MCKAAIRRKWRQKTIVTLPSVNANEFWNNLGFIECITIVDRNV